MSKRIKNRYKGPPYQWLQRAIVAPTELYRLEREIGQILSAKEDNLPQPDYDNSSYRVHRPWSQPKLLPCVYGAIVR